MKNSTMCLAVAVGGWLALANTVFAFNELPSVPDSGCSLLLFGISVAGLALVRKFRR